MCGRFTLRHSATEIAERFDVTNLTFDFVPRYNIAPTQPVAAITVDHTGERWLRPLKWGLVPFWAKDPSIGSRMINARAESLADKAAYKHALERRRCLIPADGFYEWVKNGTKRMPMHIHFRDGRLFAFAGLWDRWSRGEGQPIESCALITTSANALVAPIHGRMPVLIDRGAYDLWLDPRASEDDLRALLAPFSAEAMEAFPVSPRVNGTDVDDADLARPVTPEPDPGQMRLF